MKSGQRDARLEGWPDDRIQVLPVAPFLSSSTKQDDDDDADADNTLIGQSKLFQDVWLIKRINAVCNTLHAMILELIVRICVQARQHAVGVFFGILSKLTLPGISAWWMAVVASQV